MKGKAGRFARLLILDELNAILDRHPLRHTGGTSVCGLKKLGKSIQRQSGIGQDDAEQVRACQILSQAMDDLAGFPCSDRKIPCYARKNSLLVEIREFRAINCFNLQKLTDFKRNSGDKDGFPDTFPVPSQEQGISPSGHALQARLHRDTSYVTSVVRARYRAFVIARSITQ